MSEADRAPVIQLSVDQEVFVDSVRDGDAIEDATVATEVTSFDRIGDAYVLEGAIVFAGYLTRAGGLERLESAEFDTLSIDFDEGPFATHVHHRMPFVLRVPTRAQPRGIVNVKSRIAAWKLEVISAGWLRVVADLTVTGLNGENGYHFQCGAQEQGDLFFDPLWNADIEAEPEVRSATYDIEPVVGESAFKDPKRSSLTDDDTAAQPGPADFGDGQYRVETADWLERPANEQWAEAPSASPREPVSPWEDPATAAFTAQVEALSAARGGFEVQPDPDGSERQWQASATPSEFERETQYHLDRAGAGASAGRDSETDRPTVVESPSPRSEQEVQASAHGTAVPADPGQAVSRQRPAEGVTAQEFEFEHQVSADDESFASDAPYASNQEEFVASRSFGDDGFHAASGFVPTVRVGSDLGCSESRSAGDAQFDDLAQSENADEASNWTEYAPVDRDLWSFVDFNGPEQKYTLRYTIVMEEETLELVAERLGCSKQDLMKVNRLATDSVRSGQPLRIPSTVPGIRV
jgi:hypothetical protein